jgi:tetratricopeptide (TPR) repeat protein
MSLDPAAIELRERIWTLLRSRDPDPVKQATELCEYLPAPSHVPDELTAQCLFDVGFELERLGDDEQAMAKYRQAARYPFTNPKYAASAWFRIGICVRRQGRYQQTVECFRTALDLSRDQPHLEALAHYYLGELLEAAEDYEQAATSYRSAMELLPHPDIRASKLKLAYGRCCWRIRNSGEAARVLGEVAQQPDEPASAEAWRWLAEIAEACGDVAAATEAYRQIIEHPHSDPNLRALAAMRCGDLSPRPKKGLFKRISK